MRRRPVEVEATAAGGVGQLLAYGDFGRPLLVFPSEQGAPWDWEERGMIGEVAWLVEEGRLKIYCVDSFDARAGARPARRSRSAPGATGSTSRGSSTTSSRGSTTTAGGRPR